MVGIAGGGKVVGFMKVVQIVPHVGAESSGPSYSVPMLCHGLAESGVETQLCFLGESPERLKRENYVVTSYPQRDKFNLGWSPEMLKGLCDACMTADIIHNNSLWMMPNVYPAWAVKGTKCKLVVAPRGTLATWSLKKGWLKKKIFGWLLQNRVLRRADMFHATSEKEYEEIRALGYKQPVAIVPIGMEVPEVRGEGEKGERGENGERGERGERGKEIRAIASKPMGSLTVEERSMVVDCIESTEVIDIRQSKDARIQRFVKGYWDGDAKTIKEIVEWGKSIVPARVENRYIGEIQTYKNSIRSILFHTRFRGPLKVLVLEHLDEILKNAVLFNKGKDGEETFFNLAHRLRFDLGDGREPKEFVARLIVKETADGNRTWTVEFSNKKELTGMPTTGEAATVEVTHLKSPSTHNILKWFYAVKGEEGLRQVVFFGRLHKVKAVDRLVKAWEIVNRVMGENGERGERVKVGGWGLDEGPRCQTPQMLSPSAQWVLAEKKVEAWLAGVTRQSFEKALINLVEEKSAIGEYRFKKPEERDLAMSGARRFFDEFSRKIIRLSDGRCVYFAPDVRSRGRNGNDLSRCWAEYAFHAVSSSGKMIPGKDYPERWFNKDKMASMDRIVPILHSEVCKAILLDKQRFKDAVAFLGETADARKRIQVITRIDYEGTGMHNLAEVTVLLMNARKNTPPLKLLSEVVETVERHQGAGYLPSTIADTIPNSSVADNPPHPEISNWELVIAGPDNGIRGELEQYIAKHQIPRVRFVGEINGPAKYEFLSAADLYVLPSFTENFGVTVAEALACGTPVIVSKGTPWGGVEGERGEKVERGRCGWWVENTPEVLAETLREAMALSDEERRQMGEAGREWIRRDFSWEGTGAKMKAAYEWLLNGGERPEYVKIN